MADTSSTLNGLIETLKDGEAGFKTAAGDVKDARVKATFNEFAQQRARMAAELTTQVSKTGQEPAVSGSVSAAAHRGWMNIKSALGGGEKAILEEAERGEDTAVKEYEKAMKESLPPGAAEVVRRQYGEVKQAHDRVKFLRDSWKKM